MYKKLQDKDYEHFLSIFLKEHLLYQSEIKEDYFKDELHTITGHCDLVIFVHNAKEISEIMKYANREKIKVAVRGSGTGLVGSCVLLNGGIIIDISKMNHILELDEKNFTLTLEPGVLLMDIYKYVEERGFFYPPDPGEKSATISGNISTNAGGMRAVKYGVTRDYVLGLEIVLPTGEIMDLGGKIVKDCSGYSLKNLIIGSEGTLAVISKAVLKLLPLPKKIVSILVPFSNYYEATTSVPLILQKGYKPSAIEYFDQKVIELSEMFLNKNFPEKNFDSYLLLTFDNNEDLDEICEFLMRDLKALDCFFVDTDERKEQVWSSRKAFLEAIKGSCDFMDECDCVVPRENIYKFLEYIKETSNTYQIRIPFFGHAGDGNLHIYICREKDQDPEIFQTKLTEIFDLFYKKSMELGGLVSGEHGIGYAKKSYLKEQLGESQMELMKRIKLAFDPNYILNPNKIFD